MSIFGTTSARHKACMAEESWPAFQCFPQSRRRNHLVREPLRSLYGDPGFSLGLKDLGFHFPVT